MSVKIPCRQIAVTSLLIVVVLLMQSCRYASEQEDFDSAKQQKTLEAWDAYLTKHPNGQHASVAKEAFDILLFQQATRSSSDPQYLETIFNRCKTSAAADKVFKMWDAAAWKKAKELSSFSAYREYLLRFPRGVHVEEAKMSIEEAIWRTCQRTGQAESYEQYVKEYPGGKYIDEARKVLKDLAYKQTKEKDTVESYEEFLKKYAGHESAGKRLRQLQYERAVRTGTLEDWMSFYDRYRYSGWVDDGKDVEHMKENAEKEIERALYDRILSAPSLELCKDYLHRYRNGPHKQQVIVKMEPYLFDLAIRTNDIDTYLEYLDNYPKGYRDKKIKELLNTLIFTKLDVKEDFDKFEEYLRLCLKDKPALLARMEPFMFDWAKRVNTVESYEKYIEEYPKGPFIQEVRTFLERVLFKKAQEEDWYSIYEDYIMKCPDGSNVQKARKRIKWLKANKAIVEVAYPKVIEQRDSPYWNVSSPFWEWETIFKEKSGKVGFKVRGLGYIKDPKGGHWGSQWGRSISRGEVKVPAGGEGKDKYWCSRDDHEFCNGYAIFTWTGEDAGGHPIELNVKVKLQHTSCSGPRKEK